MIVGKFLIPASYQNNLRFGTPVVLLFLYVILSKLQTLFSVFMAQLKIKAGKMSEHTPWLSVETGVISPQPVTMYTAVWGEERAAFS